MKVLFLTNTKHIFCAEEHLQHCSSSSSSSSSPLSFISSPLDNSLYSIAALLTVSSDGKHVSVFSAGDGSLMWSDTLYSFEEMDATSLSQLQRNKADFIGNMHSKCVMDY